MAEIKEDGNKTARNDLKKGDEIEIYGTKTKSWYKGNIYDVFVDDDKIEWFKIKYKINNEIMVREVQRYSNQIRIISDNKTNNVPTIKLLNDIEIPVLGYGVYQLSNTPECVNYAIKLGYRHIDTAIFYDNETEVGKGVRLSKIDRKDIFVTTKLWSDAHGSNAAKKAINNSLKKLNIDYIDLYLIHSPYGGRNIETYKTLLEYVKIGKIKSVGV